MAHCIQSFWESGFSNDMFINEDMFDKFASLFNRFVRFSYSYCCLIILWLASFVRTACWYHDVFFFDVDTPYPCELLPDALLMFVFMLWFSSCGRFKRGVALRQYHEWK